MPPRRVKHFVGYVVIVSSKRKYMEFTIKSAPGGNFTVCNSDDYALECMSDAKADQAARWAKSLASFLRSDVEKVPVFEMRARRLS